MNSLRSINSFLDKDNSIAVVGVSRNKKKFGRMLYDQLRKHDYSVFPVNSNTDHIEQDVCFANLSAIEPKPLSVLIASPKETTKSVVEEALSIGITKIWIQPESYSQEIQQIKFDYGVELIAKECILMFLEPVKGVHCFHRFLKKITGKYPK